MANPNDDLIKAKKLLEDLNALRRKLDREPLKLTDEQLIKQLKSLPEDISSARRALSDMADSATNLYERLRGVTSELKGQETATAGVRKAFRSLTADAEKLKLDEQEISKLSVKELSTLQKRVQASQAKIASSSQELINSSKSLTNFQEILKNKKEEEASQEELNNLVSNALRLHTDLTDEQKAMLASYFDAEGVVQGILDKTQERLNLEQEINRKVRGFSALSDLANAIPGLRKFAGPFQDAEKAARKVAEEGGNGLQVFAAGGKALLDAFGPLTMIIGAFNFLKDVAFNVSKQTTEIGKAMGLSTEGAEAFRSRLVDVQNNSKNILVTTSNLLEAQTDLASAFGATKGFTDEQLQGQIKLTKQIGLSAEVAGSLQQMGMLNAQSADQSVAAVIEQTAALAKQTGIQLDNRKVLEDVSKVSGRLAANLGNNPGKIAAAVTQMRRFGLNLQQAESISKSLLDFESSIGNELEAELLTGKDLNLERARGLALQGDFAGATAEVAKQVGSLAEFQSMNVLAQEALAKASGMTVDELANSLRYRENLASLGQQERDRVEQIVKTLREQGRVEEANRVAQQVGNAEDAQSALNRIDAQTKFNAALDKAKSIFADMFSDAGGIGDSLANFVSSIAQSIPLLKAALVVMGALAARTITVAIANAFATGGATAIAGAAALGISAAILGGMALFSGDSYNPAPEETESKIKNPNTKIKAEDFTIQTHPKDTLVMAGGTKLGDSNTKTNQLLERLIAAVEKGGNVYMDGNEVGKALVLSSYQSS